MASRPKRESKRSRLKAVLFRKEILSPSSPSPSSSAASLPIVTNQHNASPLLPSLPTSVSSHKRDFWTEALQKLSSEDQTLVHKHVPVSSSVDTNRTFSDMLLVAQREQNRCQDRTWTVSFFGRNFGYREEVGKVINWLQRFKTAGDVAANADPIHAGLPWAVIRVFLQAAVSDQEQMGAIFVGINKVAYILDRCGIYSQLYLDGSHKGTFQVNLENALSELYTLILQFLANALRLSGKNTASRALSAFWKPEEIIQFEARCDAVEKRVEIEAHNYDRMLDRQIQHDTSRDLNTLKNSVNLISSTTDNIWIQQENEKQGMILKWVSSIPHLDHHDTAVRGRSEGTGGWLFHHSTYKMWETSKDSKILWLHGIPGAGKTKLITRVIDNFEPESKGHVLAFFYCNRAENSRRNEEDVLRSFVKQLGSSTTNGTIHRSLLNLYNHKQKSGFASERLSFDECGAILDDFMSAFTQCTLVLDALDECHEESRSQLIKWFTKMIKSVPNLKILISSRRNDDIKRQLRMEANLGIEATDNEDDIRKFVLEKIELDRLRREEEGLPLIPDNLKDEIVKTLFVKSEGMFQWTTLQTAQLFTLERGADIRAQLGKLPTGLKNAYSELWVRIEDQKGSAGTVAKRAFQWMMVADSLLHIQTLITAVCQDPDRDEILPIDIGEGFILGSCQNLIVVDKDGRCRFAHLSIREYLEEYAPWKISECHETVTSTCLNFLLRSPFGKEEVKYDAYDNECLKKLYSYAVERWRGHAVKLAAYPDSDRATSLLMELIVSPTAKDSASSKWAKLQPVGGDLFYLYPGSMLFPAPSNALLFVCYFDLTMVLNQWLATPGTIADINANISTLYGNALSAAILGGARKTVQILLENGADINKPVTVEYQNWVISRGTGAEQLLFSLENRRVTSWPAKSLSVLILAVMRCDVKMTRFLIESGADVNSSSEDHDPVFGMAMIRGYDEGIVELMIEKGADVNTKLEWYGDVLTLAASRQSKKIVQLMIEKGADINSHFEGGDYPYNCALEAAVKGRKLDTVQLLLENGADIDKKPKTRDTMLGLAVQEGDKEIVRSLIQYGADVNAKEGRNSSVLKLAAAKGHEEVVRLLIEHGADESVLRGSSPRAKG